MCGGEYRCCEGRQRQKLDVGKERNKGRPLTKLPQCIRVGGLGHRDRQLHAVTVLENADPGLMGVDATLLQKIATRCMMQLCKRADG